MSHDKIQSLVARCLMDPEFLMATIEHAKAKCDTSRTLDSENRIPDECIAAQLIGLDELERLILFSAFIIKVKHNNLRRTVPLTFQLLAYLNLELDFFARFSAKYLSARVSGPLSTKSHLSLFESYLLNYVKLLSLDESTLIKSIFIHELTLWQLSQGRDAGGFCPSGNGVRWEGWLRLKRYSIDVLSICNKIKLRDFTSYNYNLGASQVLAYWQPSERTPGSVFIIDELTALILSQLDGQRSVQDIASSLARKGFSGLSIGDLAVFFEEGTLKGLTSH